MTSAIASCAHTGHSPGQRPCQSPRLCLQGPRHERDHQDADGARALVNDGVPYVGLVIAVALVPLFVHRKDTLGRERRRKGDSQEDWQPRSRECLWAMAK